MPSCASGSEIANQPNSAASPRNFVSSGSLPSMKPCTARLEHCSSSTLAMLSRTSDSKSCIWIPSCIRLAGWHGKHGQWASERRLATRMLLGEWLGLQGITISICGCGCPRTLRNKRRAKRLSTQDIREVPHHGIAGRIVRFHGKGGGNQRRSDNAKIGLVCASQGCHDFRHL